MAKKLLAISCGTINSNTETFCKAALMGAEEAGMEVELVRALELDLHYCKCCFPCPVLMKGPDACIFKDDGGWLLNKVMDCDAIIIGAPVYSVASTGVASMLRDRISGPKLDAGSRDLMPGMYRDERLNKKRVGGLISVGGAMYHNWATLGLPTLHTITFPPDIKVIDQLDIIQVAEPGAAALEDEWIERCKEMGRNLAKAVENPYEASWMDGTTEDDYLCPMCHNSLVTIQKGSMEAECAICGIKGQIVIKDGGVTVEWPQEQLALSRLVQAGKDLHAKENMEIRMTKFMPRKDEVPEKIAPWKEYAKKVVAVPPSRQK